METFFETKKNWKLTVEILTIFINFTEFYDNDHNETA